MPTLYEKSGDFRVKIKNVFFYKKKMEQGNFKMIFGGRTFLLFFLLAGLLFNIEFWSYGMSVVLAC